MVKCTAFVYLKILYLSLRMQVHINQITSKMNTKKHVISDSQITNANLTFSSPFIRHIHRFTTKKMFSKASIKAIFLYSINRALLFKKVGTIFGTVLLPTSRGQCTRRFIATLEKNTRNSIVTNQIKFFLYLFYLFIFFFDWW